MKKVILSAAALEKIETILNRKVSDFTEIRAKILVDEKNIHCRAIISKSESLHFAIKNEPSMIETKPERS